MISQRVTFQQGGRMAMAFSLRRGPWQKYIAVKDIDIGVLLNNVNDMNKQNSKSVNEYNQQNTPKKNKHW